MMRTAIGLLLALLIGASVGLAREYELYSVPISSDSPRTLDELGYDDGEFEGWCTSPNWSDEEQVGFIMPDGGPWHITTVKMWIAGTGEHHVIFREACNGVSSPPCGIIDESVSFTPGYPAPPDRWIEIDVSGLGLVLEAGEEIFVGVAFDGIDDGLGLDESEPDGHSWGLFEGSWEDDTYVWGVDAGIRLGISDEPPTPTTETTWSSIKGLFE